MKSVQVHPREFFLELTFLLMFMGLPQGLVHAQAPGWTTPIKIKADTYYAPKWVSMAMNHRGEVFVVWQQYSVPGNDLLARLYFTSFDGSRWSAPVPITDTLGMDWTPDVAVDSLGYPHVVWGSYMNSEIYYSSFDGITWSPPENVSQNAGESYLPRIAIDQKNNVHVVWHDKSSGRWAIHYRTYDGQSWLPVVRISDSLAMALNPHVAVDRSNNLHVSFGGYVNLTGSPAQAFYTNSTDGGASWSLPLQISKDTMETRNTEIALRGNGHPVIVWDQAVDITQSPVVVYIYSSTLEDSLWSAPQAVWDTSFSTTADMAIDSHDGFHVVWDLYDPVKYLSRIVYSHSDGYQWSQPIDLSGANPFASDPHIVVDDSGRSHTIWLGGDNCVYYSQQTGTVSVPTTPFELPRAIVLEQNYPNPFNPSTTISYSLLEASNIVIRIFDALGRDVKVLEMGRQAAGIHTVYLDGSRLASGVYFYQLRTSRCALVRKMLLLR